MISDKDILLQAKKRYDTCETYWSDQKQKATEILRFIAGEQWSYNARQNFENAGFAAMTSNRLPTFLRQITNELRKNTPEIKIDPFSDADREKAEAINDLIRNIQAESQSEIAYCDAAESAASVGIGYFRVLSKYKDNNSMDQELCIEPIVDVNTVMLDPNHKGICAEDIEYAFITITISKDEYLRKYGKTKLAKRLNGKETDEDLKEMGWSGSGKKWTTLNEIVISEYYFKDYQPKTLYQIQDTATGEVTTTYDLNKDFVDMGMLAVLNQRDVQVPVVRWTKLNDLEVLEKSEWPGEYIPIIAVKGDEFWIDDKRKLVGAVEPAIEAQVQLNYAMSWRAQLLQMAPKAPYIGTADQFKTYEQEWANVNVSNQAFMTYNKDEGAPPPQRDLGEVPIQGATVLIGNASEDLRAIFGTFDPSQQAVAPESGKAILARQAQAYNSNYHFYDNLSRSIEHCGKIIVDAIPVIYDTARQVQLLSIDGKKKTIAINQPNEEGVVEYDMSQGEFTVSIQTGPSFGTKRQEESEAIMNLIGVYPQSAVAIADIAVRSMDWPGADKIADSLEAMVPPEVLQARKFDPKQSAAMVPRLQAQLQQMTQQNQLMQQQLHDAANKLQDAANKVQIETMKANIDDKKIETDSQLKLKQLQLDEQKVELEYLVREQELKIQQQQLEIEKAQLAMQGVKISAAINDSAFDKTSSHIERLAVARPGTGETDIGGLSIDKPDAAEPHELKESSSGLGRALD
jgi:hypothetical protein